MMKSWADHCSSDEDESVDDNVGEQDPSLEEQPHMGNDDHDDGKDQQETFLPPRPHPDHGPDDGDENQNPPHATTKTYDFPDKPPFTAFVGNLAFSVKEPDQLKDAIMEVVHERLGQTIHVLGGRIATDRRDGKHRGFGYVEVETLDEVCIYLGRCFHSCEVLGWFLFSQHKNGLLLCMSCARS